MLFRSKARDHNHSIFRLKFLGVNTFTFLFPFLKCLNLSNIYQTLSANHVLDRTQNNLAKAG